MQLVDLPARYIGADIVDELIAENHKRFANDARCFVKVDLTAAPLPLADLIFCRDCLAHLLLDIGPRLQSIDQYKTQ